MNVQFKHFMKKFSDRAWSPDKPIKFIWRSTIASDVTDVWNMRGEMLRYSFKFSTDVGYGHKRTMDYSEVSYREYLKSITLCRKVSGAYLFIETEVRDPI